MNLFVLIELTVDKKSCELHIPKYNSPTPSNTNFEDINPLKLADHMASNWRTLTTCIPTLIPRDLGPEVDYTDRLYRET